MKKIIALLLVTSLTANAWLALRIVRLDAATAESAVAVNPTRAKAPSSPVIPLDAFESSDPAVWRDRLREAGADEPMVRALLEGALRQRYREKVRAERVQQWQFAWWRSDARKATADNPQLLREAVQTPLRELLGRDPLDAHDAEKRFDFLPPVKRRQLAEIALDYAEMDAAAGGRPTANALKSDFDRVALLADERRKDVMAALTPEERAEYDLRFEGRAGLGAGRLSAMNGTEQEFRALRPILDEMRQLAQALPLGDDFPAAYTQLTQRTIDRIAAAI